MAEKKQQNKKSNNHRSADNKSRTPPHKKAAGTSKSSPVNPNKSDSDRLEEEQDQETDGLTELFKCVDQLLRKDVSNIAKRVTKQIERGFNIKQMIDWMKKHKGKSTAANGFEELLSKIEQEADRDCPK